MKGLRWLCLVLLAGNLAWAAPAQPGWRIPTAVKKLSNGLIVVVSEDHSAPTFGLCISYGIGFRLEPEGRSGFAHLFEHMMFEGTPDSPKGTFDKVIEGGGGVNNGDTRYDFTEYIETAPVSALEPVLWLEADRMKTLDFSQQNLDNQRKVVEEEVRVNVLNQPFGSFFWLDLPQKAFNKYPNAHNFYGDFEDLDAASVGDVQSFFEHYYAPNNAVLAVVGDVKPDEVFSLIDKYFGGIAARQVPPRPDVSEPPQAAERRFEQQDKFSQVPALAVGYRMPAHDSQDAVVGAVVGNLLHDGQASLLFQSLVKDKKVALEVEGGANWPLGNPFEYDGPTLMTSFIVYPPNVKEADVLAAYDAVVSGLATQDVSATVLARVSAKMRSDWYSELEMPISRASALSHAALFDGSPESVNRIPDELAKVTPAEVKAFARKYLVGPNRTIINRAPAPSGKTAGKGEN